MSKSYAIKLLKTAVITFRVRNPINSLFSSFWDTSVCCVAIYGAFTIGARLHSTEIRTIGKMFHVLQQIHGNYHAINANARTK